MHIQQGEKPDNKREVVAGRYEVEERLGKGGMGTVYRVFDQAAKRHVALKLLDEKAAQSPTISALFEREYHTLAQLAHPRIVEVYDYGVDEAGRGAYYTMELLDGADLRKLAPLSWKDACALLRDVASSLALLHSRRLLHRDVSARNVRCTADGRAKLIDFGAMVPFGSPPKLIGTPPYVAPEAYHLQPLDQRADLYSLGALAYWLIGGQYAYRARELALLPDAWRSQPKALSALVPDLPPALNDLVMSLLSLDRMARPFCAAEVMERLAAIGGLDTDEQVSVSQAYLNTPSLIGRGASLVMVRQQMLRALTGLGSTLMVKGQAGTGRSRFLDACVLEGRLAGAVVLRADATDANAGDWGAVQAMARQLLDALPEPALHAARAHGPVLGHILPELLSRLEATSQQGLALKTFATPQELRPQVQAALSDWFVELSRRRCLVLAVDDVHRIDEPSAAFVALMSDRTPKERLVVVATAETDAPASSEGALSLLSQGARRVELKNLGLEETEQLLCSVFGEVPNVRLVSDRLHAISNGNPKAVMQLAQHLLDRAVVRYEAGAWSLPSDIDAADLPQTLSEALEERVRSLSLNARELAQSMALCSTPSFSLEDCLFLVGHGDKASLMRDIDQLVASDILRTDGTWYALSQASWRPVLLQELTEGTSRTLHLHLAELLQQQRDQLLRASQHLLQANEPERALDTLLEYIDAVGEDWTSDPAVVVAFVQRLPGDWIGTVDALVGICERLKRPRKQRFLLLQHLAAVASVTASPQQARLSQLLHQLYCDAGLDLYEGQDASQDDSVRLRNALRLAQQRFDATPESERVLSPAEAIPQLARTIVQAMGSVGHAMDYRFFEAVPSLQPLVALSPALGVIEKNFQSTRHAQGGRYERARWGWREAIERMDQQDRAGLDEVHHKYMRLAMIYTVGIVESLLGLQSAAEWADEIEEDPLFEVNSWRLRMLLALHQGDAQEAEDYRKRAELLQIQNSPTQLFEGVHLWTELQSHAAAADLLGVKQTLASIEKMARKYPGWIPALHFARGQYQKLRGDFAQALAEFEQALGSMPPGRHRTWAPLAGAHLSTLVELGQFNRAKALARAALEVAEREDPAVMSSYLGEPLALALAALGEFDGAVETAQAVIDNLASLNASGVAMGSAYETRARVAISMNDQDNFAAHAQLCAEQYRAGRNPALTAKYERLMQAAREANLGMPEELRRAAELSVSLSRGGDVASNVRQRLAGCNGRGELLERALALVVERTGSQWGYLYLRTDGALALAAQSTTLDPPEDLLVELDAFIGRFVGDETDTEQSEIPTRSCFLQSCVSHVRALEPMLLAIEVDGESLVVGVAVVCQKGQSPERPGHAFFEAVARCLHEGDDRSVLYTRGSPSPGQSTAAMDSAADGRYVVEAILGQGGMGAVYRARDTATGKWVAVKRTLGRAGQPKPGAGSENTAERNRLERLLRREYQTLQSLAHPRIVEVYDFGADEQGPYYTMELLDGEDLRQMAPLAWQKACALLRDVASSLSLLHSRRLLHRDVTARNVRCTAEGHAKLMDFGAMTSMGLPKDTVGTPPHMPPESIFSQPLDQRSDLYSLGALAYWLLTGRHAYPAMSPEQLPDLWRSRTRPPSSFTPEIPEALDNLVMSLLSLDPLARPACAAEVMERLSAIANLGMDEQLLVPQAYLTTPTLVGRDELLLRVRKQVIRASRARGGAIIVRGAAGVGRSRFLDACVLESKLAGLTVLRADASDAQGGDYAVARALVRQLLRQMPAAALSAAQPHLSVLSHVLPELTEANLNSSTCDSAANSADEPKQNEVGRLTQRSLEPEEARVLRPQIQAALRAWFIDITRHRALTIAVDDVHRTDEPSAALVALLANEASNHRLVVAVTAEPEAPATSQRALSLLSEAGAKIDIKDLGPEHTEKLLSSVFGDVPNVRLLSDRLHAISGGNPQRIMQLAQHLLDKGLVRYQAGAWTLPSSIDAIDLPQTLSDALKARVRNLSANARELAQSMALCSKPSFAFDNCLVLTGHRDPSQLLQDLDELSMSEILSTDDERYGLSQAAWRSVLTDTLEEAQAKVFHLRLAALLEKREEDQFLATQHLLHADEPQRALDTFLAHILAVHSRNENDPEASLRYVQLLPNDWIHTCECLLSVVDGLGRPRLQRIYIQLFLTATASVKAEAPKSHFEELITQLCHDTGLDLYESLDRALDPSVRLQQALELAQRRFENTAEHERGLAPLEAIPRLAQSILRAIGAMGSANDYDFFESLPSLEPLCSLSPALGIIEKNLQCTRHIHAGRPQTAFKGNLEILDRMAQPDRAGLLPSHHRYMRLAVMYSAAWFEGNQGLPAATKRIDELEKDPLFEVNAWRLRLLMALRQGNDRKAEQCKKRVELLQVQNSPTQFFEGALLLAELQSYADSDDLLRVKQTIVAIEQMAKRYGTWVRFVHWARGEYQRIRGDHVRALAEFEQAASLGQPAKHWYWVSIVGARVSALLSLGRNNDARTLAVQALQVGEREHLYGVSERIRQPLALAHAAMGEYDAAIETANTVIGELEALGTTGLARGGAYETRARIAVMMRDQEGFLTYASRCAEQFRVGQNPALTAKYEKLVEAARKAGLRVGDGDEDVSRDAAALDPLDRDEGIRSAIAGCRDRRQRTQKALSLLLEHCEAKGGHLFGTQEEGLTWLSSVDEGASHEAPPQELKELAELYLAAEVEESTVVTMTAADQNAASATGSGSTLTLSDGRGFEPVLLFNLSEGRSVVVGLAALVPAGDKLRTPSPRLVSAISDALLDTGDVVSMVAAA